METETIVSAQSAEMPAIAGYSVAGTKILEGQELLDFVVNAIKTHSASQMAEEAGYVRKTPKGEIKVSIPAFQKAHMEAQGIQFRRVATAAAVGRKAEHLVSVQRNGNLMIGGVYTRMAKRIEGSEYTIAVDIESGAITLTPNGIVRELPAERKKRTADTVGDAEELDQAVTNTAEVEAPISATDYTKDQLDEMSKPQLLAVARDYGITDSISKLKSNPEIRGAILAFIKDSEAAAS